LAAQTVLVKGGLKVLALAPLKVPTLGQTKVQRLALVLGPGLVAVLATLLGRGLEGWWALLSAWRRASRLEKEKAFHWETPLATPWVRLWATE
jgi:hypothetical protein